MKAPGVVYASERMMKGMEDDQCLQQVVNVACLPGIRGASIAMPDIHWGYGFPIGGVAAFDAKEGVISPGGVGYDISCGVRLHRTTLTEEDVRPKLDRLVAELFRRIPCGMGQGGAIPTLEEKALKQVGREGAKWAVRHGYGREEDLDMIEDRGALAQADPAEVGPRAYARGRDQVGTLGSGNHFLEVDVVDRVLNERAASVFGLFQGQVCVQVHCGSRGFGHQVCDDYLKRFGREGDALGIRVPDRQLASVPFRSPVGQAYYRAMAVAVNFARANREVIGHRIREAFASVFATSDRSLGLELVYDVSHNIAKVERHAVNGVETDLVVHRKGATRAFPAGHPEIPEAYRTVGQPVLIPGDMGRASFVLVGTDYAMAHTWGSTCHGAGRAMSRHQALKESRGRSIADELAQRGIIVMAKDRRTLAEEMPLAYKNVDDVVDVVAEAGLSNKVARLRPIGVVKG